MRRVPAIVACLLATLLLAAPAFADNRSRDLLIAFDRRTMKPDHRHSLAASWKETNGGLKWTYKLRPNLRWSDGMPLTAADVVWTMNFIERRTKPAGLKAVKKWKA